MAKRKADKIIEEAVLEVDETPAFAVLVEDGVAGGDIMEDDHQVSYDGPQLYDPEWPDYVASLFVAGECDDEGCPRVHGLRRVIEKAMGPIMAVRTQMVQLPSAEDDFSRAAAVVSVDIEVKTELGGGLRTFSDAADMSPDNQPDENFLRFAVTIAATRAEARCYRKALKLRKVAAEEKGGAFAPRQARSAKSAAGFEPATDHQRKHLDKFFRDLDINGFKFINSGEKTFRSFADVDKDTAAEMFPRLNELLQGVRAVPASMKGYLPGWEK